MKYVLTILLTLWTIGAKSQLIIDGRKVLYNSRTNTMLATIPQSAFGSNHRATIELEEGWSNLKVNSTEVKQTYTFRNITGGKKYPITIVNKDKYVVTSDITFTFLPILQLTGDFGYDYQDGVLSLYDAENSNEEQMTAVLKWRGGITNTADRHKRNYKVKFSDNHQFFGFRNDNKWILDAGQADLFRVRNRIATELWNDMARKPYYYSQEPSAKTGVEGKLVEVFLNNEYAGIYCLTEAIDRKELQLKKFDKETGEIHGGLWKSENYGISQMFNTPKSYDNQSPVWESFEVKYPKLDDVETTDYSTLWNAINFVATSSNQEFKEHVAEYFDLPVLIDYYIFLQVLCALDNCGKNMYWAVYDKAQDKKLTLAVWDLDGTVGQAWLENYVDGTSGSSSPEYDLKVNINLYNRLVSTNACDFNAEVSKRYYELRKTVLSTDNLLARYTAYFDLINLSGAGQREQERWSGDSDIDNRTLDFESEIYYICYWIARRLKYLDDHKFDSKDYATSVGQIDNPTAVLKAYDLQGRQIHNQRRGLVIEGNRKYLK